MAKWQRWERGVRRCSYKGLPPRFAFDGFWETTPRFASLRILHYSKVGRNVGFCATATHVAHLSTPLVATHRIIADFSAIY